jgi:polyhydroxyalkanoate synthase
MLDRVTEEMPISKRPGPRPLPFHLMAQVTSLMSSCIVLPHWKSGSLNWKPASPSENELRHLIARQDGVLFHRALTEEGGRRFGDFLKAVDRYRRHPYRRSLPAMPTIWRQGGMSLLDYGDPASPGQPILVVPSLINRAYILDLRARRSLVRWLGGRGFRPFLVDWGAPGEDELGFGLDPYVTLRLSSMLDRVLAVAGRPVLLGYCMGGLLSLALAALRQKDLLGQVLMATPWDFHSPCQRLAPADSLRQALRGQSLLSPDMLQILFALGDPLAVERKFRQFGQLQAGSAAARNFVAVEDWVNDCVPLTTEVAEETLMGWYGENRPAKGEWRVGGETVDPTGNHLPTLLVIPTRDRIVPAEQAWPLVNLLPAARHLSVVGGHIGMVVGPRAVTEIYNPIAKSIRMMSKPT